MPLSEARSAQWPPLSDLILYPGFGAGVALLAAIVVVLATSRRDTRRLGNQLAQQERHHQEVRVDKERCEAIERCWQRLVWLIKTASLDPADLNNDGAGLGLGPELTLAILEGLTVEAERLEDDTLTRAVAVYLSQYGLVLGERAGSLADVLDLIDKFPEQTGIDRSDITAKSKAVEPDGATASAGKSATGGGE